MEKIKKYFGEYEMTWPKVIIFALIAGVLTGVLKIIPFLDNTSFQDIAINIECWILFAVFIIVNCKKWWEAALKCFVFFLISQPLVYLVQVPFSDMGWGLFGYYRRWGMITLLTLPGAVIAFFLKKKNWLSVVVLAIANCVLAYSCGNYIFALKTNFPYHLLSAIFCLALAVFFVFVLFDDKKHKAVSLAIIIAALIVSIIVMNHATGGGRKKVTLDEGNWSYAIEDQSVINVEIADGNKATIKAKQNGSTYLTFVDEYGNEEVYFVTVSGGGIWLSPMESEDEITDGIESTIESEPVESQL